MKKSHVKGLLKRFAALTSLLKPRSAGFRPGRTSADQPGISGRLGWPALALAILLAALTGCNQQPPAAHGFPPAGVTVSKPVRKEIVDWNEFTGRTAAVNLVTVTARVSGYIVNIPFKEGDLVHKGDLLFQIDPRPYQDVYDQAVGQLKQAQANQELQEVTYSLVSAYLHLVP